MNLWIHSLLIYAACSKVVVLNMWYQGFKCETRPDAIVEFDYSLPNKTGPPSFSKWVKESPLGYCGRMNNELQPYQCCRTSLNVTATEQSSNSYEYIDPNGIMNNIPNSASGNFYCMISKGNTTFPYLSMRIASDVCIYGFNCNSTTQQLELYSDKTCKLVISAYPIGATEQQVVTKYGQLTIVNTTISGNPNQRYIWLAQLPSSLLVINSYRPLDFTAVFSLFVIFAIYFVAALLQTIRALRRKTPEAYVDMGGYVIWLVYAGTTLPLKLNWISDVTQSNITKCLNNAAYAFATLLILLRSIWITMKMYNAPTWLFYVVFGVIILIHLLLNPAGYLYYQYIYKSGFVYDQIALFKNLQSYWTIILVVGNLGPLLGTLYIVVKLTHKGFDRTKLKKFLLEDRLLTFYLLMCIFSTVWELSMSQFRAYSRVSLGYDWLEILYGYWDKLPVAFYCIFLVFALNHLVAKRNNRTVFSAKPLTSALQTIRDVLRTKPQNSSHVQSTASRDSKS